MTEPRPDGLPQPSAYPAANQPHPTDPYPNQANAYPQAAYPGQAGGQPPAPGYPPNPTATPGGGLPVPPAMPGGQPGPRLAKRSTMVALAVVAGVLLIATGLFTTLFVVENGHHRDVVEQIAVKEKQAGESSGELDSVKSSLQSAEQSKSDLESQNSKLTMCVDAAKEWLNGTQGTPEYQAALDRMFDHCQ